jgi:hypothetical protein
MNSAVRCRIKAAEFRTRAAHERNSQLRAQFESLAHGYSRLAEQADRKTLRGLLYETSTPLGPDPEGSQS